MASKSLLTCAALTIGLVSVACLGRASAADDASSGADQAPAIDAFSQNKRLGRGVNVLGYDPIWKDHQKARFQENYFRMIKDAGFSHVRVNLHPFRDNKLGPDNEPSAAWFDTLDWVLTHALASHLMVILDFHEFQAMGEDPTGNRGRMLGVWRHIARHCKDAPDHVLFEILNEPNKKVTPALWNGLLRETLAVIRESNPRRTVVIGPTSWNNINDLDKLELPEEDRNVIVTVHYYSPFQFTHQGAAWAGLSGKTGVPWNGTMKEQEAIIKDFAKAQAWAHKHHRPIYLGEFGAYDKAEMRSRVRWANFVARQAESLRWSWAWWQFDGDFVLYDTHQGHWVDPIRRALIPGIGSGNTGRFTYVSVPKPYPFFPFCIDWHDARHRAFAEQAAMLKELGYDGVGHIWLDKVDERLKTLDAAGLKLYQVTMSVNIAPGKQEFDQRFTEVLKLVKGRHVQFDLIVSGAKPSDASADARGVTVFRKMSDLARDSGSQLLLYPHTGNWIERIEDAVRVADKVDRPNVGVMFNLCHWLRVDKGRDYRPLLKRAVPRLWAVSINGADTFDEKPGWDHYIQPLDRGSFDVGALLRTLKDLGYRGPIGLQCYGIGGDAREHLERSMTAWKKLSANLKD